MNESAEIQAAIERHNREIVELREELHALKDGQARKELKQQIDQRIAELEADIKLQELQETMAKEQAEQDAASNNKKRGWFGW
jgi:hypothetical protein